MRVRVRRRHGGGIRTVLVLILIALFAFYAANWQGLHTLGQRAHARVEQSHGHWVALTQVSPWFPKALIATEDQSFWTNWGISFEGMARAIWVDIRAHGFVQGGSTLTEQLVRDLLLTPQKTLSRKASGILLAFMASRLYSKTQILTFYINEIYLGAGTYGIEAASQRYFGIPAAKLTPAEATLLAGLPESPSALNPLRHLKAAKARQRVVLDNLVTLHELTPAQANRIWNAPLPLRSGKRPAQPTRG